MDDSRESFQVFSPRLLLRTDFISHEEIVLMYNRYHLGSAVKLNYPYDERRRSTRPSAPTRTSSPDRHHVVVTDRGPRRR